MEIAKETIMDQVIKDCEALLECSDELRKLLEDPQPGLFSWCMVVGSKLKAIKYLARLALNEED